MKVLLAGESFITTENHTKGFDFATLGRYEPVGEPFVRTLEGLGMEVTWLPNHIAQLSFPDTVEALAPYDVVILSDITSNTLLLHPDMMFKCQIKGNRLLALREYVLQGGGLLMIGGYMSFCGFEGKARYGMTPLADVLPVKIMNYDDRIDSPEGVSPVIVDKSHPLVKGIEEPWPQVPGLQLPGGAAGHSGGGEDQGLCCAGRGRVRQGDGRWRPPSIACRTGRSRRSWSGSAIRCCGRTSSSGLRTSRKGVRRGLIVINIDLNSTPAREAAASGEVLRSAVVRPGPLQQQLIDAGPMDSKAGDQGRGLPGPAAAQGLSKVEYGYCMMEDGTGYLAVYTTYPNCTPEMLGWWFRWLNVHTKGMPEGQGNLKYKIWNPADHWDHGFINGKDKWGGIYTVESLDLGQGEEMVYTIRHAVDLRDYGLTEEREQALNAAGCWVDCAYESFHSAGSVPHADPGHPSHA